jgi:cytochrome c-type biogenesis protein CcmH
MQLLVFWGIVALLIAVALAFLLPALTRPAPPRDEAQQRANLELHRRELAELDALQACGRLTAPEYASMRDDVLRRMLEEAGTAHVRAARAPAAGRRSALALAVLLPAAALGAYLLLGRPEAIGVAGSADGLRADAQPLAARVEKLAERLRHAPEDGPGWAMLARALVALGRHGEAVRAFEQAAARVGDDAQLLADYADVLAVTQGKRLDGAPAALIERALAIDPQQPKALALAGTAAYGRGDFGAAVDYWQRALPRLDPGSPLAVSLAGGIADARRRAGMRFAPAEAPLARPGISGVVRVAPELAARVAPTDTVFIFARAENGPPLAVLRKSARELPVAFFLDDSTGINPQRRLSAENRVVIGARISRKGDAVAGPGDLQGFSAPVDVRQAGVVVVIDSEVK